MSTNTDTVPSILYIWFASNDGVERTGDRFIRAWTDDVSKVDGLRNAIGRDPQQFRTFSDAEQAKKDAKTAELHKMLVNIMHDQTTAMQSALIEWKHGKGAEDGLGWIVNTLDGPGLLPDFDAEHGKNAQFWFDTNRAEPFPKCFCGNPSHQLWMGQGFCCNEHYREAKAKHDAAQSSGDQS